MLAGFSRMPGELRRRPCFVYLTEVDISVDNGPGINEREFVAALLHDHAIDVCCVLPEPQRPDVFRDSRIDYVPAHRGRPLGYLAYLLGSWRRVHHLNRKRPIAALVFRPGGTPLLPFFLRRTVRVPVLLKKLGLYSVFGRESSRSAAKNALSHLLFPLYRSVIAGALAADVESFSYVPWLQDRFAIKPARIEVIPNGVNTLMFAPSPNVDARASLGLASFDSVVGYVGALSRIRRVEKLLQAFAGIEGHQKAALVLVGSGPDEASLRAEAADLGLGDRCLFVGSVNYADVPSWMSSFNVAVDTTAVCMRVKGEVHLASYSQKIGQYLACGVPVVAWYCRDTEFLDSSGIGKTIPFPDVSRLTQALQGLLSLSGPDRTLVRSRAREVALDRFDSRALATRRVEWWKKLVGDLSADGSVPTILYDPEEGP